MVCMVARAPLVAARRRRRPVKPEARATRGAQMEEERAAIGGKRVGWEVR